MRRTKGILAVLLGGLALTACGGDGSSPASPSGGGNRPPTVTIGVSSTAALVSVSSLTFSASASDPDGDSLTYQWDFGDGSSASGQTVRKTYDRAGAYQATVRVTDSRGASGSSSTSITAKSLDGLWEDASQGYGVKMSQSGSTFTGRTVFSIRNLTGSTKGSVNANLEVQYSTNYGFATDSFSGRLDPGLDNISGKLVISIGRASFPFNLNLVRHQ